MIKILIVDDNVDKVRHIVQAISKVNGLNVNDITFETNAHSAKKRLEQFGYDLMILDIALPNTMDSAPVRNGGILLLEEIIERDHYKKPTHVIGITEYPDAFQEAFDKFSRRLLTVLHYNRTTDEWIHPLRAKILHIISAKNDLQANVSDHQSLLAIVCALDSPELSSIRSLDWSWQQHHQPNDNAIYYQGEFTKNANRHMIYAAAATRMGMPATAILATKMITAFRPKYLAMSGIAAGIPGKTRFGDIIVANPVWDYGNGKWVAESSELRFQPAPHHLNLSPTLSSRFRLLKEDFAFFSKIHHEWMGEKPDHPPELVVGPLASGSSVIADGLTVDRVKMQHRGVVGIEMETYALFAAAEEATEPSPEAFSIKSVVDFADGSKNDNFQRYAAYTSAKTLKNFVENFLTV